LWRRRLAGSFPPLQGESKPAGGTPASQKSTHPGAGTAKFELFFPTAREVKNFAHFFIFSTCDFCFSLLFSVDIAGAYDKMTASLKG
jgi:hypothetical protein